MAGALNKTRSVMDLHNSTTDEVQFYAAEAHDLDLYIDRATWDDLGAPRVITITIEPGDKLNEETE